MASIHGGVFIIVGLAVGITSKIVDSKTQDDTMTMFFFAGIIMAVYGILKLFVFRKKSSKTERRMMYRPSTTTGRSMNYCPNCGAQVNSNSNFCANCGTNIK